MFRRLPSSLPKDIKVPADLEQLGYFINEKDQLRLIQKPEQKYQYRINRNERVNEVYKEAVNSCVRHIVRQRFSELGLEVLRLPIGAQVTDKHVPIYISRDIQHKKRVLVIFGERDQELGIFSYRSIGEDGINVGSALDFVSAIVNAPTSTSSSSSAAAAAATETPGVIIANPGQLIWYRGGDGGGRAITYREYLCVPRETAVHGPFRIDPRRNRVEGNANYAEHVHYVFENVMNDGLLRPDATFDLVGLEYTGDAVVEYLSEHWDEWRGRVNGICLGNPQFKIRDLALPAGGGVGEESEEFVHFLSKRVRAYFVSDKPIETPLPGREERGCNCYASGEQMYEEGILIKSWRSMLDWFNMIAALRDYEEPMFSMVQQAELNE